MKKYENYKDSGLEWLGMVPEHWEILPFKRGVSVNNGRDYKHVKSEDGYPVIGSGGQFAYASDYLYDGEVILLGRISQDILVENFGRLILCFMLYQIKNALLNICIIKP